MSGDQAETVDAASVNGSGIHEYFGNIQRERQTPSPWQGAKGCVKIIKTKWLHQPVSKYCFKKI
ncbi:MAG: hypothetical protein NT126_08475 [Bacteroidetes bacterium]|nr:hypothetical protein [Bacteroidota bacterium]